MMSLAMSLMMSSVKLLMMSSGMTSSVMCPITLHQKQMFHIPILRARPPGSRLLSTLGGLANSPIGGMPPGEVWLGFLDNLRMLFSSRNFADFKMAPRGTGLLEKHLTLNLATETSKTGQDCNCNYCGYLGIGWQRPARARAHLSGEKGHGVTACPNVPKDVKNKLLKEAEEKLKRNEQQQNKKRIFLSQQKSDEPAESAPKKQATLDALQDILKTELDVSFAEFMYHAGFQFHISDGVMLRHIDKLIKCVKAGLPHAQLYPPNRHKLADGFLDKVYNKISEEIAPIFAANHHTRMVADGYSNIRRNSVINYNYS